jgi:hypothetical protein
VARETSIMRAPDASRGRSAKLTTTTLTLSVESRPPNHDDTDESAGGCKRARRPPGILDPAEVEDLDNGA